MPCHGSILSGLKKEKVSLQISPKNKKNRDSPMPNWFPYADHNWAKGKRVTQKLADPILTSSGLGPDLRKKSLQINISEVDVLILDLKI